MELEADRTVPEPSASASVSDEEALPIAPTEAQIDEEASSTAAGDAATLSTLEIGEAAPVAAAESSPVLAEVTADEVALPAAAAPLTVAVPSASRAQLDGDQPHARPRIPAWLWLALGVVALVLFGYYFYQNTFALPLPNVRMVSGAAFQPRLSVRPPDATMIDDAVGIDVDSKGNIYIANRRSNEIRQFDPSGVSLASWPLFADISDKLPEAMHIYHDHIYALDKNSGHINEYDTSGKLLTVHNKDNAAGLSSPNGFCFDPQGMIYVASTASSSVIKMDQQDHRLAIIGGPNLPKEQQVYQPFGCAISADGSIYAISIDGLVHHYDKDGNPVRVLPTTWLGHAVEVGVRTSSDYAHNRVYIADAGDNALVMIDTTNDAITIYGTSGHADGQFTAISAVAVNDNGDIYTVESEERRLQVFNRP